jgi:Protein of unknown function (DUF2442)
MTKSTSLLNRKKKNTPRSSKTDLVRVRAVEPTHDFWVHVTFTNDVERDIDLEPKIWGPVFEPLRNDPALFRKVFVDPLSHTLAWPGELDLDPDTLYYGDSPPWVAATISQPEEGKPGRARVNHAANGKKSSRTLKQKTKPTRAKRGPHF